MERNCNRKTNNKLPEEKNEQSYEKMNFIWDLFGWILFFVIWFSEDNSSAARRMQINFYHEPVPEHFFFATIA